MASGSYSTSPFPPSPPSLYILSKHPSAIIIMRFSLIPLFALASAAVALPQQTYPYCTCPPLKGYKVVNDFCQSGFLNCTYGNSSVSFYCFFLVSNLFFLPPFSPTVVCFKENKSVPFLIFVMTLLGHHWTGGPKLLFGVFEPGLRGSGRDFLKRPHHKGASHTPSYNVLLSWTCTHQ